MIENQRVLCITLNWNRREETLACIGSLKASTYSNKAIMVVDNASVDGSREAIAREHPDVELVTNSENVGFAAGFNAGLRRVLRDRAEFAFIINNDALIAPEALGVLVATAEPKQIGVAAPIIYYLDGPSRVWSAGADRSRLTLELTGDHSRRSPPTATIEREFVSGCAMLIRGKALREIGLFDERFFLYYEDSDFCLRMRRHGYRILLNPAAKVWHATSSSSGGSDSPNERYWMGRSSVLFFRKHAVGSRRILIFLWRAASTLKTLARLLIAGRFGSGLAYLRGSIDGLRSGGLGSGHARPIP